MTDETYIKTLEEKVWKYEKAIKFAILNGRYADKEKAHLTRGDWGNEIRRIAEEG